MEQESLGKAKGDWLTTSLIAGDCSPPSALPLAIVIHPGSYLQQHKHVV